MSHATRVVHNLYRDSVSLMELSAALGKMSGIEQASAVMATMRKVRRRHRRFDTPSVIVRVIPDKLPSLSSHLSVTSEPKHYSVPMPARGGAPLSDSDVAAVAA